MEAIASKLDAVQLQLAQLASSHESTQGTLAVLHSSLSMSKSANGPLQHCQKLARFADDSASPSPKTSCWTRCLAMWDLASTSMQLA
jgi:hypothetical protein